jgi:hypothetical protein
VTAVSYLDDEREVLLPPDEDLAREVELPTFDSAAEDEVLAALLDDAGVHLPLLERVGVRPEDGAETFRCVAEAIIALHADGAPTNHVAVAGWLRDRDRLARVGGIAKLTQLHTTGRTVFAIAHVEHFVGRIRRAADARALKRAVSLAEGRRRAGDDPAEIVRELQATLQSLRPKPESSVATRLATVDAAWLGDAPPPREYLAHDSRTGAGAIEAHGVALLVSAGGIGKSYATVALALAVATASVWLGVLTIARAGRVLILTAEDSRDEVQRRLYHVARSHRIASVPHGAIDVLDLHDTHTPLLDANGGPTEHAEQLLRLVTEHGPYALVVVDPLARLAGAPIDADNVAAGALVTVLERIATSARGLVLGVHHTSLSARKTGDVGATAIRGATGLGDSARLVMTLAAETASHGDAEIDARLGEIVTLRAAKANHVRRWDPIELRRGEHGELLPLDAADRDMVSQARSASDPQVAREEARTSREATEDAAVLRVVSDRPGISTRDLERAVRVAAGCGSSRAQVAIERVTPSLRIVEGPRRARMHYPATTVPASPTEGA